jgi:putative two-component system response regulator
MESGLLIVDDENANLAMLSRILCSEYALYAAKSGEAALRLAACKKPDLILLDIVMPDMSGFEVIKILKENPATRHIPVIFITGLEEIEKEKGFALGAADYIVKPFTSQTVRERVKTYVGKRR